MKLKTSHTIVAKSPLGPVYVSVFAGDTRINFSTMAHSNSEYPAKYGGFSGPAIPFRIGHKKIGVNAVVNRILHSTGNPTFTLDHLFFWKYNHYPEQAKISQDIENKFRSWALKFAQKPMSRHLDLVTFARQCQNFDSMKLDLDRLKQSIPVAEQQVRDARSLVLKEGKRLKIKVPPSVFFPFVFGIKATRSLYQPQ